MIAPRTTDIIGIWSQDRQQHLAQLLGTGAYTTSNACAPLPPRFSTGLKRRHGRFQTVVRIAAYCAVGWGEGLEHAESESAVGVLGGEGAVRAAAGLQDAHAGFLFPTRAHTLVTPMPSVDDGGGGATGAVAAAAGAVAPASIVARSGRIEGVG